MAELKLGYKHYPKDLTKFKPVTSEVPLTNLRIGNDIFIEISRTRSQFDRTATILVGLFGCSAFILFIYFGLDLFIYYFYLSKFSGAFLFSICFIMISLFGFTLPFAEVIKSVFWPTDCLVRINRKTGKVYVYEPQLSKRHYYFPLREVKKLYKPIIKVFDWQDVEGMVTREWPAFKQIFCVAIVDRKSDRLIDYFTLWDNANFFNNEEWRWLLSYMDGMQGMNYKGKIRNRFWLGRLFNCFAPEFNWPEGIDKASRSETIEELAQIEQQYNLVGKMYPYEQP